MPVMESVLACRAYNRPDGKDEMKTAMWEDAGSWKKEYHPPSVMSTGEAGDFLGMDEPANTDVLKIIMTANMEIQENLALAYRRGKKRGLAWGITKDEKELFYEKLKVLGLGLEERMTSKVCLLSGGQRQALTLLMASLIRPELLLLDEHTAALDPKTAAKVLDVTENIIEEQSLAAIMVTHNMKDAIRLGNRLIMMHEGKIIYDVSGEEKKKLQVSDLLEKFEQASGGEFANDRMMLA